VAVLTTSSASQLREPWRTRCPTAAASGGVGTSVANLTVTANNSRDGSKATGFTNKKAQVWNAVRMTRRTLCLDRIKITIIDSSTHKQATTPRESGFFFLCSAAWFYEKNGEAAGRLPPKFA